MSETAATSTRSSAFRRALVLLCMLLVASGALELHHLADHHRAIAASGLFDPAASHPGSAHHFERSAELRDSRCVTCTLQAQARGVEPCNTGPLAPPSYRSLDRPGRIATLGCILRSSASPRGPPAA